MISTTGPSAQRPKRDEGVYNLDEVVRLNHANPKGPRGEATHWWWAGYHPYGGNHTYAQGDIGATYWSSPVLARGRWKQCIGGDYNHWGIRSDGTMWSGGGPNDQGQRGDGTQGSPNNYASSPTQVAGTNWYSLADNGIDSKITNGGPFRSCCMAKREDGTLWAWGYNNIGQLGLNDTINRSAPVQIPGDNWTDYANNDNSGIAFKDNGELWEWGQNGYIHGTDHDLVAGYYNRSSPYLVPGSWAEVSKGGDHTVAIKEDGTGWCWGQNGVGQLGITNVIPRSSPVQFTAGSGLYQRCFAGQLTTIFIDTDGTSWFAGNGISGQAYNYSSGYYSSPTRMLGNWDAFRLARNTTPGATWARSRDDGHWWFAGYDYAGKAGLCRTREESFNSAGTYRSNPVRFGMRWTDVYDGYYSAWFTKDNSENYPMMRGPTGGGQGASDRHGRI